MADLSLLVGRCWRPDRVVYSTVWQATRKQFVVGADDGQAELEVAQQGHHAAAVQRRPPDETGAIIDGGVEAGEHGREHASQPFDVQNHQLLYVGQLHTRTGTMYNIN